MRRNLSRLLVFLFAIGDLLILNASIFLSYYALGISAGTDDENSIYLFIFSNLAWFFLILVINPYRLSASRPVSLILRSHFSFLFTHLLVVASLVLFFDKSYHPLQLLLVYLCFLPSAFFWRLLFFYALRNLVRRHTGMIRYVILGNGELARDIRRNFKMHPEFGYQFLRTFDEEVIQEESVPFSSLQKFCLDNSVNEILCCLPDSRKLDLRRLFDFGLTHFIKIALISDMKAFYQKGIQLERHDRMPVRNVAAIPLDETGNRVIKRAFDLLFAAMATLLILSWLTPLVAILIKMDSRGPVFYRQRRAGKFNQPFNCLKFRTMYHDEQSGFVQATKNDPRITRVGKFLRKTSLDEFPQFFNVLSGEMSVVGPRPHPMKLNDDYSHRIKKLMSRHYVKPGVSGLAQCMGYRGETANFMDMKNRITLDRFYVENWSLWFDIRIIFQTVISIIKGPNKAY